MGHYFIYRFTRYLFYIVPENHCIFESTLRHIRTKRCVLYAQYSISYKPYQCCKYAFFSLFMLMLAQDKLGMQGLFIRFVRRIRWRIWGSILSFIFHLILAICDCLLYPKINSFRLIKPLNGVKSVTLLLPDLISSSLVSPAAQERSVQELPDILRISS